VIGLVRQQVTPGDQFVAAQAEAERQMRLAAERAKAEDWNESARWPKRSRGGWACWPTDRSVRIARVTGQVRVWIDRGRPHFGISKSTA